MGYVRRTADFAEAEILLDGNRWLVCIPLSGRIPVHLERTANRLRHISSGFLTEYRLLCNELELTDDLGRTISCDIILNSLPDGEPFGTTAHDDAAIRRMVAELHAEFLRLGFSHNNLKPSNLVIGNDGRLHPLRYHYASFDGVCRDDFSRLEGMCAATEEGADELHDICAGYRCGADEQQTFAPHEGLVRFVQDGKYGFREECGCETIPACWLWADDFMEGRATVEGDGGFGLIDKSGREIVPARFDDLLYDVRTGRSKVFLADKSAEFSYTGVQLTDFL